MGKWKITFPCGFTIEEDLFGAQLAHINEGYMVNYIKESGCLIHGKKCSNNYKGGLKNNGK